MHVAKAYMCKKCESINNPGTWEQAFAVSMNNLLHSIAKDNDSKLSSIYHLQKLEYWNYQNL